MDVKKFMARIKTKRVDTSEYAETLESWEELFKATGQSLKERNVPPRVRRWILAWTERVRRGVQLPRA